MNKNQIKKLFKEFHVPKHVIAHSCKVAEEALFLAKKLIKKGEKINLALLESAAFLHDLVRVVDFRIFKPENFPFKPNKEEINKWCELRKKYKGKHHADAAYEILCTKKYTDLAEIIKKHKFLSIITKDEVPTTWEEKLLFYADKRVNEDKIVSLKERFEKGRKRNTNGKITKKEREAEKKIYELERSIFNLLDIKPENLI